LLYQLSYPAHPLSGAKVKERVDLYLFFPSGPMVYSRANVTFITQCLGDEVKDWIIVAQVIMVMKLPFV
jgi:hypothetical protein